MLSNCATITGRINFSKKKITNMQERRNEYTINQDELLEDRGKLVKLYQEGIINSNGENKNENNE